MKRIKTEETQMTRKDREKEEKQEGTKGETTETYTKHVQEQCSEITLTLFGPPRHIDKITLQQPQEGFKAHPWVPARTSTVHRCPRRKAVGGPQHDPQCDKRAQPNDRHHCL